VNSRYPIGKFEPPAEITHDLRHAWITDIAVLPRQLQEIVHGMSESELESTYREGGWTIRQIIHHLADSHLNCYCRYKLALTETSPVIKPYDEAAWAELIDARTCPIDVSLSLLTALHTRWVCLLKSMGDAEFQRTFVHPEMGPRTLDVTTGLYAWHGRHHMAHIRMARSLSAHA
jgi:hypothetical protein